MKNLILVLAAVLVSSTAFAGAGDQCTNEESTFDTQQCLSNVLSQQNAEINKLNALIILDGKLSGVQEASDEIDRAVLASAKSFADFRNDNCDLDSALFTGGTARGGAKLMCMVEMTEKRIVELTNIRKSLKSTN
jgi:uncharacterized protein YecT (DUF1311 family)